MKGVFRVVGNKRNGYAVLEDGAILYDNLETRLEAERICSILVRGIGPEWDAVGPELERLEAEAQ